MKLWHTVLRFPRKRPVRALPSHKHILVVEDDEANRQMLQLVIEQATPYSVLVAATGREALWTLQTTKPDLILLDYALPDLTGLEVYKQLRTIPGYEAVPVVFVTASVYKAPVEMTHLLLIEKPFDLDTLLEAVRSQLASV